MKAVYAQEPKVLVVAPPGSGKTRVMCTAIQEYMALHPTHSVTAITYTKKAAAELTERIKNPRVKTGTIHSWALQQLYKFGRKYNFTIELLEEEEMKRIMQQIANKKNMRFINIFQLYNYITGSIKTLDLEENLIKKYEKIKALYIEYKQTRKLYDFTDLPQYLLDIMEEYEEEIYDIDAFFVDEFQDVDAVQLSVFDKVCANKKFLIGDFRQAIYYFNGALEDVFDRLAEQNFKTYHLDTNYRSYQLIMDVADSFRDQSMGNSYITAITNIDPSPVICNRGEGGAVYYINEQKQITTFGANTTNAIAIISRFLQLPDTMFLCRSNKQVRKLQALGISNCSTVHQAKGLEYDNVVLCDIMVDNEEELNVAYVGMTRARNELCVINYNSLMDILSQLTIPKIQYEAENVLF